MCDWNDSIYLSGATILWFQINLTILQSLHHDYPQCSQWWHQIYLMVLIWGCDCNPKLQVDFHPLFSFLLVVSSYCNQELHDFSLIIFLFFVVASLANGRIFKFPLCKDGPSTSLHGSCSIDFVLWNRGKNGASICKFPSSADIGVETFFDDNWPWGTKWGRFA